MQQRSLFGKGIGEEKLHAQAEGIRLQQSLFDACGLGIIVTTPEGIITAFNLAAERLLGYSADEVIGRFTPLTFHDREALIPSMSGEAGTAPPVELGIGKAWRDKHAVHKASELIRKDTSRFPASVTVVSLTNEDGSIAGYAGIIGDLTQHEKLHRSIISGDQKFRLLAENVPGVVYLCNKDDAYSVIYINDQITTLTGYPKEEFYSGKVNLASLFHPDDRQSIYDIVNKGVAERRSFRIRYRIRHASGAWRWVDEMGTGVFEGDRLTMLEGFLLDITLQKETEEKLWRAAEANLRFFNSPANLNAVTDMNGNLLRISPSWTRILQWDETELKSQPVFDFIHPEDLALSKEALKDSGKSNDVITFENRLRCHDGSYRWMLWALAPDVAAGILYASAIDISARKKSEKSILESNTNLEEVTLQLQEQNRKLDEFAHIISHNLRAPINNIQALINLLDERSDIKDYRLIFDKLRNVAKNLRETMNELMDTLKVKAQAHEDLTEVRFKEVLDKVVQSLEGELIVAQASVTFDFNEASAITYSKPYLESIFQNLLTNAIKYRSPDREPIIHFKSTMANNHLELSVSDNGRGIDMEKFGDKIFGLHKTFHDHQEARGVGLFLVKTQIEALGGTIRVSSEVDKGTTFTIRFTKKN